MGEVDGGAALDGGTDRRAARVGGAEQSGMARGCGAAALEKGYGGRVRCLRWTALRSYAEEDEKLFL
jgi:hypothetical protein